ncbi:MAG TPA: Rieske 2Fe-2S domain-containing protein [Verrucomicrobiae bacterium]|jgi:nitrite reductase/ring-hydroxylating ferredoxin subunit|nr:Rieske 2Fe-2S domain-containing protein [Verrucomicrobiae bacterium]
MAERKRLASIQELRAKRTIKFTYREEGISREGFLALIESEIVCYENVCRHLPLPLDYGDGRFFTEDEKHFVCQTHGAMYDLQNGLCVAGPCVGASLKKIHVEVRGDEIWIQEN